MPNWYKCCFPRAKYGLRDDPVSQVQGLAAETSGPQVIFGGSQPVQVVQSAAAYRITSPVADAARPAHSRSFQFLLGSDRNTNNAASPSSTPRSTVPASPKSAAAAPEVLASEHQGGVQSQGTDACGASLCAPCSIEPSSHVSLDSHRTDLHFGFGLRQHSGPPEDFSAISLGLNSGTDFGEDASDFLYLLHHSMLMQDRASNPTVTPPMGSSDNSLLLEDHHASLNDRQVASSSSILDSKQLDRALRDALLTREGDTSHTGKIHASDGLLHNPLDLLAGITNLSFLSRGAHSPVYTGTYQGQQVAVKFVACVSLDHHSMALKEAVLSRSLVHPNVVRTLCTRVACFDKVTLDTLRSQRAGSGVDILVLGSPASPSTAMSQPQSSRRPSLSSTELVPVQLMLLRSEGPSSPAPQKHPRSPLLGGPNSGDSAGTQQHVLQEVIVAMNLNIPHYVSVSVMEFCNLGTLDSHTRSGPFGPQSSKPALVKERLLINLARQVAQGMAYLHSSGLMHGDLKPANVLLQTVGGEEGGSKSLIAKVADFGLVHLTGNSQDEAEIGTVAYSAPERLLGHGCKASDVYSFGVLLCQMAAGERPFDNLKIGQIMFGILYQDLKPTWPTDRHLLLRDLFDRCLALDVQARPTFDQIVKELVDLERSLRGKARDPNRTSRTSPPGPGVARPDAISGTGRRTVVKHGTSDMP